MYVLHDSALIGCDRLSVTLLQICFELGYAKSVLWNGTQITLRRV
jgi:hypothetical protein